MGIKGCHERMKSLVGINPSVGSFDQNKYLDIKIDGFMNILNGSK